MSKSVKGGEVPHPPDRRAFTLVEVVVALVLLGVGALGMGALLRLSSMEARAADHRERALWVLVHVADSLEVSGWGGAGAFSDGKLTCRITGPDVDWVLDQFVACGGRQSLLYEHRPHLGSNRLPLICRNFRSSYRCDIFSIM